MRRYRHLVFFAAALVLGRGVAVAAEPKVIALPPYLVEESTKPLPWRHTEVGGWEVLSTCSERLTRELIANHHRLHALLGELLPPSLQLNFSAKPLLLFVDSTRLPPTSEEVVAQMALTAAEQDRLDDVIIPIDDGRLRRRPPPPRYTYLPNLRLWDRDSGALFAMVKESEFNANRVALTADYVAYLLRNRLPALPAWYVSGVVTLFARARFSEDTLTLERLDWLSETGSAALKDGPVANRSLLPLGEFFAGDLSSSDATQGAALSLWQAQSALFVHWGLAGRGAPRRDAFLKFTTRAATEAVTEALFQECFGFDFANAHQQLTAHLPTALRNRLDLRPASRPRLPDFALSPAREADIARLKGEWERLEIGFVKAHFPVLVSKYVAQARRTLQRAYAGGQRDPRLLAVMGLCEVDAGDDAAAREYLEAAAANGTSLRPRAGFELARLRFAALNAGRTGGASGLDAGQAATVLTPLLATRSQQPALPEVYELIAEVWAASAQSPTRADLAALEEGIRLFPRRTELVHRTAELNVRHGFSDNARWLITLGLTFAPNPATRARFQALQARVDAAR